MEENVICSRDKTDNSGDNNIILKTPFKMPLTNTSQQNNQNIINNGIYQQQVMDNQLLLTISSTPSSSSSSSSSSNTTPSTSIQLQQNNKIDNRCCEINNVKNDSVFNGNQKQNDDDHMEVDNDKELITSNNNCNNLEIINNNDIDEEDEDDIDIEEDDGYENDIDNCNDDDDDDDLSINSDNRIFYAYRGGGGDIQEQPIRPREPSQDDETDFLEMDFDPDPSSENENFVLDNYPQQQQQQQQQQPLQQLEHEQLQQVEIFQQIDQGQPQQQINHIENNNQLITNCQVQNIIQQNEQLRHNKKQTTKQLRKELEHQYDDIRIPREINQIAKVVQQNNNRILNNQQSQLDVTSENSSSFIKLSNNNINLTNKISKNTEFNNISNNKNTGTIPKQISVNKITTKNESHINFLPCSSKQQQQQQQLKSHSSIKTYNYKDIDDSSNFMIENAITESLIYNKSSSDQYFKYSLNNNDYVSKEYQQSEEICLDCNSPIKHYPSTIYDNKNKNPCKKCQSNEKLLNQQQYYYNNNNNNNKTKNIHKLENDEERNNDRKHFNKLETKNIQKDNEFNLLINSTKLVSSLSSIQQCTDFITIYTHNCNETIIGNALTNFNILFNMEILKKRFEPLPNNEIIAMNIPEYMFYISRNNCNYHNIIKAIKESIINLDDLNNLQIDFIPLNDTSFSNASSSNSTIYNENSIESTNANTTEERIRINYVEIINRWNVNRNLKSILKFKNKSFCTENVLGKLVNVIRLYQKDHTIPTGFIEIPQYYESGYVRIARINKYISSV